MKQKVKDNLIIISAILNIIDLQEKMFLQQKFTNSVKVQCSLILSPLVITPNSLIATIFWSPVLYTL